MKQYNDDYEYDNGFKPHEVKLKNNYPFYNRNILFRLLSYITISFTRIYLFFYQHLYVGLKVTGKKNIKGNKKGKIFIANHIMNSDAFFIPAKTRFCKVYITVLQSNMGFPIFSKYIRICGAVPIPTDRHLLKKFNDDTKKILNKNASILFFPEAKLNPFCNHIRPFENGAFHYAYKNNADIIPVVFTFHKPRGYYKLIHKNRPTIKLNYLPIYKIKEQENNSKTIETANKELHQIMSDYFIKNSDFFYKDGKLID